MTINDKFGLSLNSLMPKWCVTETKRDWNNNNNGLGNNLDRGRRKNKKKERTENVLC